MEVHLLLSNQNSKLICLSPGNGGTTVTQMRINNPADGRAKEAEEGVIETELLRTLVFCQSLFLC